MIKKWVKVLSVSVAMAIFMFSQLAFAAAFSVDVIGGVIGSGQVEMKTAFNVWMSVAGKVHPVVNGTSFRTVEGTISVMLRDGAKIEIGKNAEVILHGIKGGYAVVLNKGSIGFSVQDGVQLTVMTNTSTLHVQAKDSMSKNANVATSDNTKGTVIFDGKGTSVLSFNGIFVVSDAQGKGQILNPGETAYLAAGLHIDATAEQEGKARDKCKDKQWKGRDECMAATAADVNTAAASLGVAVIGRTVAAVAAAGNSGGPVAGPSVP